MDKHVSALTKPDRVRVLNDNFRATFVGGRVVTTEDVNALPLDTKARLILAVQSFDDFTKDNDPFGGHDYASFEIDGDIYFFKIDYFDLDLRPASEDPSDPEKTTRALTIMRADEY